MYRLNEESAIDFYKIFFHFLLIFVAVILTYSATLEHGWHFDDHQNILWNKNIQIDSLALQELRETFHGLAQQSGLSRQVAYFSFGLNYYFNGFEPKGFHIVNISIHIISAFFVYLIFLQTLKILTETKQIGAFLLASTQDIALLGALLWALHPIHTQAVTYIVQRMASMAAMFYLIAMYCYLLFRKSFSGPGRYIFLLLAVFMWLAGVFTKENVILLPLALIGYEYAFLNSAKIITQKKVYSAGVVFLLGIGLTYLLTNGDILDAIVYPYELRPFSLWQRLITEPVVLARYLFLLLSPVQDFLSRESPIWASRGLLDPPVTLFANLLIFSLSVFSVLFLRKYPVLCYAVLFYFVNHLVESSFLGLELYYEHRNYLPSVFIYLSIAFYFLEALRIFRDKGYRLLSHLVPALIIIILVSEGNATYLRNDVWKSELVCMEDAVKKSPLNLRAYVTLAAIHMNRQEYEKALEYIKIAERLIKKYPDRYQNSWQGDLYANAANIYLYSPEFKNEQKALQLFVKSQEFKGSYYLWRSYTGSGILYLRRGDLKNAKISFLNAIALNSGNPDPNLYNMYGQVLYKSGKLDDAIIYFRKSLRISYFPEYHLNIVGTYLKRGDLDNARNEFLKIPNIENNVIYLLYKACLFDDERRFQALRSFVLYLEYNNISFCQLMGKINENNIVGIILPDLDSLEEDFRRAYSEYLHEKLLKKSAR